MNNDTQVVDRNRAVANKVNDGVTSSIVTAILIL